MLYSVVAVAFNILLTSIFTCGAICAVFMYRVKKLPGYYALLAIFLSYMIDNAIVFCTEIIPPFADIYDRLFLETPSIKTVCFIIRITSMLYLLNCAMPEFKINAVVLLSALHACALICVPIISQADWMVFFYYFFSQFIIICVSIWGLFRIRSSNHERDHDQNVLLKRVLLYFLIMTLLVLAEDTYVIFFVDVYTSTGLNIFNRNFSENALFIGFAIAFIVYTSRYLDELIVSSKSVTETASTCKEQISVDTVEQFATGFNLTDRELEILRCVLGEKSQQEISDQLMIALGTVKTHTHNIYSKTGAANRGQIITLYQEFLEQYSSCCDP